MIQQKLHRVQQTWYSLDFINENRFDIAYPLLEKTRIAKESNIRLFIRKIDFQFRCKGAYHVDLPVCLGPSRR